METMYVCRKCGGDSLSMVSDEAAYKGFDTHCWDCDAPSNKVEVLFPEEHDVDPDVVRNDRIVQLSQWGTDGMLNAEEHNELQRLIAAERKRDA